MPDENINALQEGAAPASKSQKKREAQEILALAKAVVALNNRLFLSLELPEPIRTAAAVARSLSAYGARKRQVQYVGKLLRQTHCGDIRRQLQVFDQRADASKNRHRQCEYWRDRLLGEGNREEAVTDLLQQWPQANRQHLRQLLRNARGGKPGDPQPGSARALFRYLQSIAPA